LQEELRGEKRVAEEPLPRRFRIPATDRTEPPWPLPGAGSRR
jgi:hypothetical protein